MLRLGINIDHIATVRNARGGVVPCPVRAAKLAQEAGADGITAHLREDRRHIKDADIYAIKEAVNLPLNMEMAATDEMLKIALDVRPNACCIVPESREELTTEGGLNAMENIGFLKDYCSQLKKSGIKTSLFIDPDVKQIEAAARIGADIVEIHTGHYCQMQAKEQEQQLIKIITAAKYTERLGIECHAGHGLCYDTVKPIAAIEQVKELNIGHFLMGEAMFIGLGQAIKKMRLLMDEAQKCLVEPRI